MEMKAKNFGFELMDEIVKPYRQTLSIAGTAHTVLVWTVPEWKSIVQRMTWLFFNPYSFFIPGTSFFQTPSA